MFEGPTELRSLPFFFTAESKEPVHRCPTTHLEQTSDKTSNDHLADHLGDRLTHPGYPRSSRYDARWTIDNQMGPHALWLLEWLAPALGLDTLPPGARVLDLGCGKAMTSVFLAKEYDVQVTAADLWIQPGKNARRIAEAGVADRVLPVFAEAHQLPFGDESFDAIVSIDAYQYFGTNDLYLPRLTRLLKPGGRIGVVMPALREEPDGVEPPEHLQAVLGPGVLGVPLRRLVAASVDAQRGRDGGGRRLAARRLAGLAVVERGVRRGEHRGVHGGHGPRPGGADARRPGPVPGLRTGRGTPYVIR